MRRYHDLGGQPGGPIDLEGHDAEPWAKKLTAVLGALRIHGIGSVDELRRHIEDLPSEIYDQPYFERWAEATCHLVAEKGLLTREEISARMDQLKAEQGAQQ